MYGEDREIRELDTRGAQYGGVDGVTVVYEAAGPGSL